MSNDNPIFIISICILWLFTFVAIIGFFTGYKEGFTVMLPMNIVLHFIFIVWSSSWKQFLLLLLVPFSIGLSARILTVQFEWIAGAYQYGETMSFKVYDVPITVGISWTIFTYCAATIAQRITKKTIGSIIIAASLSLGLHLLFAISAPKLDLWEFKDGVIPLRYYFVMFSVNFIVQFLYQRKAKLEHFQVALHGFLTMLVFAIGFLFIAE